MGEAEQKMYNGINDEGIPSKRYDQLSIMDSDRDWIDDEMIFRRNDRFANLVKLILRSSSVREYFDKEVDFYQNPKMTGETITDAILSPDRERIEYDKSRDFIHHEKIKTQEPPDEDRPKVQYPIENLKRLQPIQRNRSVDDGAPWGNYWQENGMHRTMGLVNKILKIQGKK